MAYTFGAEVSAGLQEEIRSAIDRAVELVRAEASFVAGGFAVFVYGDLDAWVAAYARWFNVVGAGALQEIRERLLSGENAEASKSVIFIFAGPRWHAFSPTFRAKVVAHEYFHVVQNDLFGQDPTVPPDQVRRQGPTWLVEGSAEYVGYRTAAAMGLVSFDAALADAWLQAKNESRPLSAMEIHAGFGAATTNPYNVGMAATELLIRSPGLPSLISFWRAIDGGARWPDAFASSFGRPVDQFYVEFDAHRTGL